LRLLVFGAGAIGTYIGGSLLLAGHRVTFLERPEVAARVRAQGLRLQMRGEEFVLPQPTVAASLREALADGEHDAALFALKSFDTQDALEQLGPSRQEMPPVLCLQNGVDNEPLIAAALGSQRVIAGTVTSAIGRRDAGDIVLERLRGIGISAEHPLSARIAQAFNDSGLNARLYPQADAMKWSKMLTNLLANATSAILDMTPIEIFAHPGLYRLEIQQLREALNVMAALNIKVVDLPATPARALAFAVQRLPVPLIRPILQKAVGGGRGAKMPSFHIDLHSGRGKSEVDYLNGAVVRHGIQAGVPTPVNAIFTEILSALTRGDLPIEAYAHQPKKLLQRLGAGE
jgi:2-dehydropantoate 2-reductase